MVSCTKVVGLLLLAVLASASCQAKHPEASDASVPSSLACSHESEIDHKVDPSPKSASQPVASPNEVPSAELIPKKESCECAAGQAVETLEPEQVVIEKAGKKFRVITITLPIASSDVEPVPEVTTAAAPDTEPTPAADIESFPDIGDESSPTVDNVEPSEKQDEPTAAREKASKKEKAKTEKKKYKRDVGGGKKSTDKKSFKRKNKDHGKKKSKK